VPTARRTRGEAAWPLYAGALIGPFGGAMVHTMLPELAEGLGTDLATAASSLTWYMLPFAGLLVVSGTLAARWGEMRALHTAYIVFAVGSLVCAASNDPPAFLAGRAIQGAANAFTTPVLIALIARRQLPDRVGRSIGMYASVQAAGQAFAPLVGGIAADFDYRLAFVATGAVALLLIAFTAPLTSPVRPETSAGTKPAQDNPWRSLANLRLARAASVAFCVQFTGTALMILTALLAGDRFGLSATAGGMLVAAFGLAGLLTGSMSGRVADRFGLRALGIGTLTVLALASAMLGLLPHVWLMIMIMMVGGAATTGGRVLSQTLFVASTPANPGGATSLGLAVQFLGTAATPLLIPLYRQEAVAAGLVAGVVALVGAALVRWPRRI
jgi:ACDE family multidrug resistance protein